MALVRKMLVYFRCLCAQRGVRLDRSRGLLAVARTREHLAALADRVAWLPDEPARRHLNDRIGELLKKMG